MDWELLLLVCYFSTVSNAKYLKMAEFTDCRMINGRVFTDVFFDATVTESGKAVFCRSLRLPFVEF